MKKYLLMVALTLPLVGCNSLSRILPQYQKDKPANGPVVPDHLHGLTIVDRQGFAPFQTADMTVVVKVKRVGEDWHVCNKYEVTVDTTGTGGVFFRNICYPTFNSNGDLIYLVLTGKPVAPIGTEYDIQAMAR